MSAERERRAVDLEATMRLMDVADEIRRRDLQVARHLERTDRDAIKRHLRERYAALGEAPAENQLDLAIDTFLAEQHRFRPPAPGLRTTLARWYVHRRSIALWIGVPVAVLSAMLVVAAAGGFAIWSVRSRAHETRTAELAALERSIDAMADDPATRERARSLSARGALGELRELERLLGLAYDLRVTGGVWRHQDGERDARSHYLIVEAIDGRGEVVALPVRNEETGRTEVVRQWGERVLEDVYDRVAADKADNGIIDDDDFGKKLAGRLEVDRRYENLGQITEW
jgi:hypothetical protein